MKKSISILLAGVVLSGAAVGFAGCDMLGGSGVDIDETKTQLYVGNYEGGAGSAWLDDVIIRFEEEYADYQLNGKTGVQIINDTSKDNSGKSLGSSLNASPNEVFFTQQVLYHDYVAQGLVRDITSLVKKQNPNDGNKSIESKFEDADKTNLAVNGKYYMIPHYELYNGLTYDAYMFESEKLYFADDMDTDGTRKFIINANTKKSCGPDGIYNTYDDGLPSSYQEFYKMADKAKKAGYAIMWSGEQVHYTQMLPSALYANYLGADALNINYNFNSKGKEVEVVTGFTGDTPNIEKVVISEENNNQHLMYQAAGLYYGLEAAGKLFSDSSYYMPKSAGPTYTYTDAQEGFLEAGVAPKTKYVAMFIEGSYWYNEAKDSGALARVEKYPTFATKKLPRFMALPQQYEGTVKEGEGSSPVLVDSYSSFAFIKSTIAPEKVELAEAFLAFCYTDQELVNFTRNTDGVVRGLKYDFSSVVGELSGFGKSVLEMRAAAKAGNSVVKDFSSHSLYIQHKANFTLDTAYEWLSSPKNKDAHFWTAVSKYNRSAKDYFMGMWLTEAEWNKKFK